MKKSIILLILVLVIVGGYVFIKNNQKDKNVATINNNIAIYDKYCSGIVSINYKTTDYSSEFILKLANLKIDELENNLKNNIYMDNQIPEALQYFGLKLIQSNMIDGGLKIYKCAAEKYYDMMSMYRMARLYQNGTDEIQKQIPNVSITEKIKPDLQKAYFWIISLLSVERAEKTGLLESGSQLGWNSIAMLDGLQNKLTTQEMAQQELKTVEFIGKRYPDILKNDKK